MSTSTETATDALARPSLSLRPDSAPGAAAAGRRAPEFWTASRRFAVLAAVAGGFVLAGGGNLDLGLAESRLGLAADGSIGPYGQVFGGWDPSIWVGQLVPGLAWSWGEGFLTTTATVRWPAAIAGVVVGLLLSRRVAVTLSGRAGVLVGVCWFGCVGLIDHTSGTGLDLVTGLWTVAALDRVLREGSGLAAGTFAALAFLTGGWPPLALVVLSTLVIGRPEAGLTWRLLVPPAAAAAGWSAWALAVAPAEAWAAALTLPLTRSPEWLLAPGVLALGLPWSPLAALLLSRPLRDGLAPKGRSLVAGWLQVSGASLLVGTVIPGLAAAAGVPALAGLAVAAGVVCERLLAGCGTDRAVRWSLRVCVALCVVWAAAVGVAGGYLIAAVAYYRPVAVVLILLGATGAAIAVRAASRGSVRGGWLSLFLLAVSLKLGHVGYYVPEWNYRMSQGPWGRAVGQWVPPHWPIYTTTPWRADLAFATGRTVLQLLSPQHLGYQPGEARYILLHGSEFENWPDNAPRLKKVAEFRDEFDGVRVLARTDGPLPWTRPVVVRDTD